jgi:hypothetical protein
MKKTFVFLMAFCMFNTLAQAQKAYFQQEANFKINVSLDDKTHIATGDVAIEYTNNSPDALTYIYMHLWGNAFKNQKSAFAKQLLTNRNTKFYFSKSEDRGFYINLNFKVDGESVIMEADPKHPDIAKIILKKPLQSGQKIKIETPFSLKIPNSFSRLGHVGESYQLTQWFPKPAVYDLKGWHQMPYLNNGEFYSEFGNFDVTITLPSNYVVGATGTLQTDSEKTFLETKIKETKAIMSKGIEKPEKGAKETYPASTSTMKTIRYTAERVHDFAWFADKRFLVVKDAVTLASGRKIDTWAMFPPNHKPELWAKGAEYVSRAVKDYSTWVGEYPYPQATAVQSALSAGAGMEYPMITVIGNESSAQGLDNVIAHEVGHNWFYGILATNERDYPWMDEGINSYYDHRYSRAYYPEKMKLPGFIKKQLGAPLDQDELSYQYVAHSHTDQAPQTTSEDIEMLNYGVCVYTKSAMVLRYLAEYVGQEKYDNIMQAYYKNWQFKHPQPEDFRAHWERELGEDLSWFFKGMIESTDKMNYALTKVKKQDDGSRIVTVKNRGNIAAPIKVTAYIGDIKVDSKWLKGSLSTQYATFPKADYDKFVIDDSRLSPEYSRTDNSILDRFFLQRRKPVSYHLLNIFEQQDKKNTGITPILSYNAYDKLMLGVMFYSPILPSAFDHYFAVAPMYSFKTGVLNGVASSPDGKTGRSGLFKGFLEDKVNYYPRNSKLKRIGASVRYKSYTYDYDDGYDQYINYDKLQFKAEFEFKKPKENDSKSNILTYRWVGIQQNYVEGININTKEYKYLFRKYNVNEIKFVHKNTFVLKPSVWTTTAQISKGFTRLTTEFNQEFKYERKNEAVFLHGFAGVFASYKSAKVQATDARFYAAGITGSGQSQYDYLYDESMLGRSMDKKGLWSHQIYNRGAGLKTLDLIGGSDKWMLGAGVAYQLPLPLPIMFRPYADAAIFPGLTSSKPEGALSIGMGLIVIPSILEIYFPLYESKNIDYANRPNIGDPQNSKIQNYANKITFMLNLNEIRYQNFRDKIKF